MFPGITLSDDTNFVFYPGLPNEFKGPFIRGAQQFHSDDEQNRISIQVLDQNTFTLIFYNFHFQKKTKCKLQLPAYLQAFFCSEGKTKIRLNGSSLTRIRFHDCLLLCTQDQSLTIEVPSRMPLVLMHTVFKDPPWAEINAAFPDYKDRLSAGREFLFGPYTAKGELLISAMRLLKPDYGPQFLPYFFKIEIDNFLFQLLVETTARQKRRSLVAEPWEIEAVHQARSLVLQDLKIHRTIRELTKKYNMAEYRFKIIFKQEFGTGPYEFLLDQRLEYAKYLIERGVPMKQAIPEAGYLTTSFSVAFKNKYGFHPKELKPPKGVPSVTSAEAANSPRH